MKAILNGIKFVGLWLCGEVEISPKFTRIWVGIRRFIGFSLLSVIFLGIGSIFIASHHDSDPPATAPAASEPSTEAQAEPPILEATKPKAPPPAAWTSDERVAPIEADGAIDVAIPLNLVDAMVAITRAGGYRCDSVTIARRQIFHKGFQLLCNHGAYTYEVVDDGSGIKARPDD